MSAFRSLQAALAFALAAGFAVKTAPTNDARTGLVGLICVVVLIWLGIVALRGWK